MLHTHALHRGSGGAAKDLGRDEGADLTYDPGSEGAVVEIPAALQQDAVDAAGPQFGHQLRQVHPASALLRQGQHSDAQILQSADPVCHLRIRYSLRYLARR